MKDLTSEVAAGPGPARMIQTSWIRGSSSCRASRSKVRLLLFCIEHSMTVSELVAANAKSDMFSLIIQYQRPGIMYCVDRLREALLSGQASAKHNEHSSTELSQRHLSSIRSLPDRVWTDHEGNIYKVPITSAWKSGPQSEAAVTGDSLLNIRDEIGSVLEKICDFCGASLRARLPLRRYHLCATSCQIVSVSGRVYATNQPSKQHCVIGSAAYRTLRNARRLASRR